MILIINLRPIIIWNTFLNMEIAENEENNMTTPPPSLATTVELCTFCTNYVFAYTFQLKQVWKKGFIYNT